MFGVCISLFVHCFIFGWIDFIVMVLFGGFAAITLVCLLFLRKFNMDSKKILLLQGLELFKSTPQLKHGVLLGVFAFLVQLLFLVYLKVFYAVISSPFQEFAFLFGDNK